MMRSFGIVLLLLGGGFATVAWASVRAPDGAGESIMLAPKPSERALTGGVVSLRTPGSAVVLIAGGSFQMGSRPIDVQLAVEACKREPMPMRCEEELFANEIAAHQVTLSAFWIDRREVSSAAYQRCVDAGVCDAIAYEAGAERFRKASYPAVLVSWQDADSYCRFMGQRLPTEAEWERAARGPRSTRFPWGEHYASRRANHGALSLDNTDPTDGFAELAPVGSYPDGRTSEGLDDLAGNAAEWTADNYEDGYEALAVTNPTGPSFGSFKVVRGGGYIHGLPWLRGAARMFRAPSTREPWLGFRCASDSYPRR